MQFYGGQGLPHLVAQAAYEYPVGANIAFSSYATFGHGAGKMIELLGTEHQKNMYVKKLYSGQWAGTMLLKASRAAGPGFVYALKKGCLTSDVIQRPVGVMELWSDGGM